MGIYLNLLNLQGKSICSIEEALFYPDASVFRFSFKQ